MKLRTILFDLDGTLIESGPAIFEAIRAMQISMGLPVSADEQLLKLIGLPIKTGFTEHLGIRCDEVDRAVEIYRREYQRISLPKLRAYPGIEEMLMQIKAQGCFIGVVTSKLHTAALQSLECAGLNKHIDYVRGALDENNGNKQMLLEAAIYDLKLEAAGKRSTVMVGDRFYDIEGAKSVGISAVGVTYGYGQRQELVDCKPLYIAESVEELRRFLLQ